jgi:hypothetical protein
LLGHHRFSSACDRYPADAHRAGARAPRELWRIGSSCAKTCRAVLQRKKRDATSRIP